MEDLDNLKRCKGFEQSCLDSILVTELGIYIGIKMKFYVSLPGLLDLQQVL